MSKAKKREYREEFKRSSAELAIKSEASLKQVSRNLGVPPTTLKSWVAKYRPSLPKQKTSSPDMSELLSEIKSLRKEYARLLEERNILKTESISCSNLKNYNEVLIIR